MSGSAHSGAPPPAGSASAAAAVDVGGDDYNFDLAQLQPPPSFTDKLWQKTKQDPLVPIGFVATCAALTGGVISMARARSEASQRFMQLRVGAQAFTLGAVVFALYSSGKLKQGSGDTADAEAEAATAPNNTAAAAAVPASTAVQMPVPVPVSMPAPASAPPSFPLPSSQPSVAAAGK